MYSPKNTKERIKGALAMAIIGIPIAAIIIIYQEYGEQIKAWLKALFE